MVQAAPTSRGRTAGLTAAALVAFAANSILCRLALGAEAIDAASFTTVRIVSGAVILAVVCRLHRGPVVHDGGTWLEAFLLFLYAVTFSFAYRSLSAGTGALILFSSVQITMIVAGLREGERPARQEWVGLFLAFGGLVGLVLPGLTAPSAPGAALMSSAGMAWGIYSLRGRGSIDPVAATRGNFVRAVVPALAVSLICVPALHGSARGIVLAIVSGAAASGLGYVVWYAALRGLTATRAAIVQLAVPLLVATAGVLFLSETLSWRFLGSATAIMGGVAMAVLGRRSVAIRRPSEPA
ncbi:MAG: DMT family transporter [Acidobacteria bacterium]|nr:DMT family transporter [Acidobacteriota bacterium]